MPIMPDIPKAEAAIIEQTNSFRASNALTMLKPDAALTKTAHEYARFLTASTLFTHEADGRRPIDRAKAAGYQPCTTAENLARLEHSRGFETMQLAGMMVEGWQNSPGHRKNMLLPQVTETGVAIVKVRGAQRYISVQLFGRPVSLQFKFIVDNQTGRNVTYRLGEETKRLEPRMRVTHTICQPVPLEIQTQPAGLLAKAVTARYETRSGQVFRLKADGNATVVEVDPK